MWFKVYSLIKGYWSPWVDSPVVPVYLFWGGFPNKNQTVGKMVPLLLTGYSGTWILNPKPLTRYKGALLEVSGYHTDIAGVAVRLL